MGVPTNLTVTPSNSTLDFGDTLQLVTVLTDVYGNVYDATQAFTWSSSNTALVSVDSTGLCTAITGNPDVLQQGAQVTIAATYPWGSNPNPGAGTIYANVLITVTPPAALTVLVPQSPDITPEEAQTFISGIANGYGWKAVPASLIEE